MQNINSYKDFSLKTNLYIFGKKGIIYVQFCLKGRDIRRSTGEVDEKKAQQAALAIYCAEADIYNELRVPLRRSTHMMVKELREILEGKKRC